MQNQNNKYFWDYTENASDVFKLRRFFEYASFPDLIKIPFALIKENINKIALMQLRAPQSRIKFLQLINKESSNCESWEEAIFTQK